MRFVLLVFTGLAQALPISNIPRGFPVLVPEMNKLISCNDCRRNATPQEQDITQGAHNNLPIRDRSAQKQGRSTTDSDVEEDARNLHYYGLDSKKHHSEQLVNTRSVGHEISSTPVAIPRDDGSSIDWFDSPATKAIQDNVIARSSGLGYSDMPFVLSK